VRKMRRVDAGEVEGNRISPKFIRNESSLSHSRINSYYALRFCRYGNLAVNGKHTTI
jgi:hypothetical protein